MQFVSRSRTVDKGKSRTRSDAPSQPTHANTTLQPIHAATTLRTPHTLPTRFAVTRQTRSRTSPSHTSVLGTDNQHRQLTANHDATQHDSCQVTFGGAKTLSSGRHLPPSQPSPAFVRIRPQDFLHRRTRNRHCINSQRHLANRLVDLRVRTLPHVQVLPLAFPCRHSVPIANSLQPDRCIYRNIDTASTR